MFKINLSEYKESKIYFKDSEVVARFSAQDCMSLDHMPYIGKYSKKSNMAVWEMWKGIKRTFAH